jgi:hypothetical protein
MAITTPRDHLSSDARFRRWGKKIGGAADLNLAVKDGYALQGDWVRWDDAVALEPGEYLVLGCETGSRKNHRYHYALVEGGVEAVREISQDEENALVEAALADRRIDQATYVKTCNNELYHVAVYLHLRLTDPVAAREPLMAAAHDAMRRLTVAERAQVLAALEGGPVVPAAVAAGGVSSTARRARLLDLGEEAPS